WLVILDDGEYHSTANAIAQALFDANLSPRHTFEPLGLGIPYLDRFEDFVTTLGDPRWAAWQLARYAELLTGFLLSHLANATVPPIEPEKVTRPSVPISFGLLRKTLVQVAAALPPGDSTWPEFFVRIVKEDSRERHCLERINEDRNNTAHGRLARTL